MKLKQGYTLIEILIALVVFAILSTITSSVLYQSFDTRKKLDSQAFQLNRIQLALKIMENDITQMIERSILANELRTFPPFIGQSHYIEFTRNGLVNPIDLEQRSTLQRVAYLCQNHQLIRRSWPYVDIQNRKQYQDKVLLQQLSECSFAYLSHARQILPEWREFAVQIDQKRETLPIAIQVTISPYEWGNMSLLFPIPEALYD